MIFRFGYHRTKMITLLNIKTIEIKNRNIKIKLKHIFNFYLLIYKFVFYGLKMRYDE